MRAALVCAAVLAVVASPALAGPGEAFGTRDPATCSSRSEPGDGPPDAEQAARYVACDMEHISSGLEYLTGDMQVKVASRPRSINLRSDVAEDPDTDKPVYDIRGSYKRYSCTLLDSFDAEQNPGRNCSYSDQPRAVGLCFVNTFGEWHCTMRDSMHTQFDAEHVPPPG